MFANHGLTQSSLFGVAIRATTFGVVSILLMVASPAYGWQDFPSFDEIMREADLPSGSGRVSNQPVRRQPSSWPTTVPVRESKQRSERFVPSNRGDREGTATSGSTLRPVQSNDRDRRPAAGSTMGRDAAGRSFTGRSLTGRNSTEAGSGFERFLPATNQPSQSSGRNSTDNSRANFGRGVGGSRNSDLLDPFAVRSSQPSSPQPSSPQPSRYQPPGNGSTDLMALPSSGPTSSPEFARPAGQSRPTSRRGFPQNDSPRSGATRSGSFGFERNGGSGYERELDAGFDNALPPRGSLPMGSADEYSSETDDSEFDWRTIRVSVGDIILPGNTIFQHTDSVLSIPEETAYLDLIQEIENRKKALTLDPGLARLSANARLAVWEECFYEFTKARQLAFRNGKLRHESKSARLRNGLDDPFGQKVDQQSLTSRTNYDILDDIRRYPDHFTGRPVVLYGLFSPESDRTMSRTDGSLDPTITSVEEDPAEPIINRSAIHGMVYDGEGRLTKATVTTGSLTAASSGQFLATVDTSGLTTPRRGVQDIRSAWRNMPPFPVLIKGWVVKKFKGDRPLIYCESMRLLSPEPHRSLVQTHTYDKQKIRTEEKWLYYETLQQMNQTRSDMQQDLAQQNVIERIDILQSDIIDRFKEDALALEAKFSAGKVIQSDYERQLASLNRQFQMRKRRHATYRSETERFPTYVDLFQNPEQWHGKLVTLNGHVRHSVSYDADRTMYDGRPLYELWLFTEDSQHTPAVILTPELPANFPLDAELVNQVSVTGCFFKRYVYAGQTERRIAPLLLAGRIQWAPTVSHVASLVKSGDLSAGSPLAVRAKTLESKQSGTTALILIGLVIIFGLMVLWGRAQREERDRLRLRDRIVDVKEIENGPPPEFASAADEYLNRVRVR